MANEEQNKQLEQEIISNENNSNTASNNVNVTNDNQIQNDVNQFLQQIDKVSNSSKIDPNQAKANNQNNKDSTTNQTQNNTVNNSSTTDTLKVRIVKKNSLDGDVNADLRNPMSDTTQTRIVEKNNLEGSVVADLRETTYDFKEEKPKEITKPPIEIIKPIMTIGNMILAEGDTAVFNVSFDRASNKPYKVTFAPVMNGTAQENDINLNIIVKDSKGNTISKEPDGSYNVPVGEVNLKVEVQSKNDSNYEGNETFSLTGKTEFVATNVSGTATLVDDGSLSNGLNDDRPLSVNNVDVNEGSPYAVFEVSGAANQLASLGLIKKNGV